MTLNKCDNDVLNDGQSLKEVKKMLFSTVWDKIKSFIWKTNSHLEMWWRIGKSAKCKSCGQEFKSDSLDELEDQVADHYEQTGHNQADFEHSLNCTRKWSIYPGKALFLSFILPAIILVLVSVPSTAPLVAYFVGTFDPSAVEIIGSAVSKYNAAFPVKTANSGNVDVWVIKPIIWFLFGLIITVTTILAAVITARRNINDKEDYPSLFAKLQSEETDDWEDKFSYTFLVLFESLFVGFIYLTVRFLTELIFGWTDLYKLPDALVLGFFLLIWLPVVCIMLVGLYINSFVDFLLRIFNKYSTKHKQEQVSSGHKPEGGEDK